VRPINALAIVLLVVGARAVEAATLPSWLQVRGRLYGLAIVDTGGGPRQRPEAIGTLELQGTPRRDLRGLLELRSRAGGPFEGGSGAALYNLNQAFQNYSPSLEVRQAFLEWRGRQTSVRAGIQTFAWGKLDGIAPTDVVNPRDLHDPLVVDEFFEEQKIGVPAVLATRSIPDLPRAGLSALQLELAYIPWPVPSRLPLALERWFPPTVEDFPADPCVALPDSGFPAARGCPANTIRVRTNFGTRNDGPARTVDAGGVAVRLRGSWRGADLELSHYTGPETGANGSLRIVARNVGTMLDPDVEAAIRLAQQTTTMHMTGGAAAFPVGPFTVRAETAWYVNHTYLRPAADVVGPLIAGDFPRRQATLNRILSGRRTPVQVAPLFPQLDAVEWGIGADTLWRGFQPLLQLNQVIVLGDPPRLLISNPETRLSGTLRRRFVADRVEAEVRGLWAIERGGLYLFPRVSVQVVENLWVRAGYLVVAGPRESLLGQYRANDQVVFQARMTF
jgi:hypothetical protein